MMKTTERRVQLGRSEPKLSQVKVIKAAGTDDIHRVCGKQCVRRAPPVFPEVYSFLVKFLHPLRRDDFVRRRGAGPSALATVQSLPEGLY